MNLNSLQIPDSLAETGIWLDDLLVSPDLVDTIVELEILAGDRLTKIQSLDGVLAGSENRVYESGLASANESVIRSLLRQPSLLLELQEKVMMNGGKYWQEKTNHAYSTTNAGVVLRGLGADVSSASTSAPVDSSKPSQVVTTKSNEGWNQKQVFGLVAALAAALLVMVSIWQPWGQGSTVAKANWGFSKSGLLSSDTSEAEMLEQLVDASASWHNKTPASKEQLEKRLREFDQGCKMLLNSDLPQLSATNRRAVHNACEDCRSAIAQQLSALKSGAGLAKVQAGSDKAIDQLTSSLRTLS